MANGLYFDLIKLIKFGNFDIKRVVRNNLTIKVADFYDLLEKFINDSPRCMEAFNKMAAAEADETDLQVMSDMLELLEDIGSISIKPAIEDAIKAGKRGHTTFAADSAKKIINDFKKIQTRITAAKKPVGADTPDYSLQTLKENLVIIEQNEASRKLRVLAVDDAPVMIKTISSVLEPEYKVYGLTNPTMVEKFLGQITPDLILLDYEMPEMNGFELIPYIRKFEEHKTTPIVFLTSMGTMEHVAAARTLGASDFIVKPFQGDNLKEKVAKNIVRKKLNF